MWSDVSTGDLDSVFTFSSQKGRFVIVCQGYAYVNGTPIRFGRTSYRCIKKGCSGGMHMRDDTCSFKVVTAHNHDADHAQWEMRRALHTILNRALETSESLEKIFQEEHAKLSEQAASRLPAIKNIRKTWKRKRTIYKSNVLP